MNQYQLFSEYITTFYYSNSKTTGFDLKYSSQPNRIGIERKLWPLDFSFQTSKPFHVVRSIPPQYFFTNFLVKNPRKANTRVSAISTFFKNLSFCPTGERKKKQKNFKSLFFLLPDCLSTNCVAKMSIRQNETKLNFSLFCKKGRKRSCEA